MWKSTLPSLNPQHQSPPYTHDCTPRKNSIVKYADNTTHKCYYKRQWEFILEGIYNIAERCTHKTIPPRTLVLIGKLWYSISAVLAFFLKAKLQRWCYFLNSPDCSTCSDACPYPQSPYIPITDDYLPEITMWLYFVKIPSVIHKILSQYWFWSKAFLVKNVYRNTA